MKETVNSKYGKGVLSIKGRKYGSALFLNGELIQFTFLREIGTLWRYQVAKRIKALDIIKEKNFSSLVRSGSLTSAPLSNQFNYIIQILETGKYLLELTSLDNSIESVEMYNDSGEYFNYDTYGGMVDIIETQVNFKESIIEEYIQLIQKGYEPIVILLKSKGSQNAFIIDGHHKFAAYGRLKKDARCFIISKVDSKKIKQSDGIEYIEKLSPPNKEYKNRFLERS